MALIASFYWICSMSIQSYWKEHQSFISEIQMVLSQVTFIPNVYTGKLFHAQLTNYTALKSIHVTLNFAEVMHSE